MGCFLSLCLIVKNEEKVLRRCLDSVKEIVDEIIVVDTGSTDRTKEIAMEFTSQVYDYVWENDFSKARNYAASKANGEWIIVLDADEYVDRQSFETFKNDLANSNSDNNILVAQIVNFIGENGRGTSLNYHERIYKNDGNINYYRSIHEMLKHCESSEKRGIAKLQIFHTGYMASVMRDKKKSERNLKLLNRVDKKEAVDYYFLGNEYQSKGEHEKAINCYKKGFKLRIGNNIEWVPKLLVRLTNSLIALDRYREAMDVVESCENIYNLVDFKFLKGKIYYLQKKKEKAISTFEYILSNKDVLKADSSLDYLEYLPHRFLAELYELENQDQIAVHHYSRAIAVNSSDDQAWSRLLGILGKDGITNELLQFIDHTMRNRSGMTTLRLVKILLNVSNLEVQKLSKNYSEDPTLSRIESESLNIKNVLLDCDYHHVVSIVNEKTSNELISILSKGIFSVVDFIIVALWSRNEKFTNILLGINVNESIMTFLNLLFHNQIGKLSAFEEQMFVAVLKQIIILNDAETMDKLSKKLGSLNADVRDRIEGKLTE